MSTKIQFMERIIYEKVEKKKQLIHKPECQGKISNVLNKKFYPYNNK